MRKRYAAALLLGLGLSQAALAQAPSVDYFVGTWTKVTYNDENDLARMTQIARGYCNIPYRIARRSPETFEMYVADALREVRLVEQNGRHYIVAQGENDIRRGARELRIRDQNSFTLRYLEEIHHTRYGLNVFVRCGGRGR